MQVKVIDTWSWPWQNTDRSLTAERHNPKSSTQWASVKASRDRRNLARCLPGPINHLSPKWRLLASIQRAKAILVNATWRRGINANLINRTSLLPIAFNLNMAPYWFPIISKGKSQQFLLRNAPPASQASTLSHTCPGPHDEVISAGKKRSCEFGWRYEVVSTKVYGHVVCSQINVVCSVH